MPRLVSPLARVEARRVARPRSEHAEHVGVPPASEPAGTVAHREHHPPVTSEFIAFHIASPSVALSRNPRRSTPRIVSGRFSAG